MNKLTYYFFLVISLWLSFQMFRIAYQEIMLQHIWSTLLFALLGIGATQIPSLIKPTKEESNEEH